jgi:hypothetical protein
LIFWGVEKFPRIKAHSQGLSQIGGIFHFFILGIEQQSGILAVLYTYEEYRDEKSNPRFGSCFYNSDHVFLRQSQ